MLMLKAGTCTGIIFVFGWLHKEILVCMIFVCMYLGQEELDEWVSGGKERIFPENMLKSELFQSPLRKKQMYTINRNLINACYLHNYYNNHFHSLRTIYMLGTFYVCVPVTVHFSSTPFHPYRLYSSPAVWGIGPRPAPGRPLTNFS